MGEVLCVSDKDLSVAGGVGQGTLRPTDGLGGTPTFKNVLQCAMPFSKLTLRTLPSGFTEPLYSYLHPYGMQLFFFQLQNHEKNKQNNIYSLRFLKSTKLVNGVVIYLTSVLKTKLPRPKMALETVLWAFVGYFSHQID